MGKNYYALVAGLPDILLEDKKVLYSSAELRENLSAELQPADFKLVQLLYMPFDHQNFLNRYFKRDQEWDERGNLPRDTVEQLQDRKSYEAVDLELLPDYFVEFLEDRKSTRLNSSHVRISYAVFCLKKKKKNNKQSHNNKR